MNSIRYLVLLTFICLSYLSAHQNDFNPYEVLGLSRTATDKDIRQAYKKLAKYWHPDKNSEPNAHEQFTKVNAAYEILSDSTKRQNYDEYGTTSENSHRGFNTNHFRDPFEMFHAHFFQDIPTGAKKIIQTHEFLQNILPNSNKRPYLIFGSTRFCFHCRRPSTIFRSLEKQFNDAGIETAEFNMNDVRLSSELGAINNPSLCFVIQHRVYHFPDQEYTESNIKEFVRKTIPVDQFIRTLTSIDEISSLLQTSLQTNRVHAILFKKSKYPTLKFIIPCLQYSTRIQCAVINSSVINSQSIPSFLQGISPTSETILLFKDHMNRPELVIKDNDMTLNFIQTTFQSNQILHLPTITSVHVFNLVCQKNSARPCFLIIGNENLFVTYRSTLLNLAKNFPSSFAYLDSKQTGFNRILSNYYQSNENKLLILAIRRWVDDNIEIQNTNIEFDERSLKDFTTNQIHIEENLKLFTSNRWIHSKKYPHPGLIDFDERLPTIREQIEYKWNVYVQRNRFLRYFLPYLFTFQFWLITLGVIIFLYFSLSEPKKTSREHNHTKIYEFNTELLERYTQTNAPNVIVILLIADSTSDLCVKKFRKEMKTIRTNSRLIFSIITRDKSSKWLDDLQKQSKINNLPSSTILGLYLRRKFFVSYTFNENQSSSSLTFSDWIDLLLEGNFRQPVILNDWPKNFF